MTNTTTDWQTIASTYKARLYGSIPPDWRLPKPHHLPQNVHDLVKQSNLLTARELEINNLDATDLRDALAEQVYTALEVTTTYLKAAAVAQQATNCLMDYFPAEALERAQWLDDEMKRTGRPIGPLHGVPISVKDHLALKGHEITSGYASWVGKEIPEKDSTIIALLRAAGAVFYCKTTNPQAIMHLETDSFLGPTVNPYNRTLTAGGSSGGEGALIGMKGSVLGIGTDIGGSIRNPAAVNGIYGFKPTATRLPKFGNRSVMVGQESIAGAIGPMARSTRDLELFISTILAAQPWRLDPTQVGMPWSPSSVVWKAGGTKPKIGIMWHDGVVMPQAPMANALEVAVNKLRDAGYEVVDYAPYRSMEAWNIIRSLYFTDGGDRVRAALNATQEPILPLTEWIITQGAGPKSSTEVFELVKAREVFRAGYMAHFIESDIDVILCPPGPGPAPVLGTSKYWGYTSIFNLVDFPSAVFPTGQYVMADEVVQPRQSFLSSKDEEIWNEYKPCVFEGAPISLQVAAARWEDEKVMRALSLIAGIVQA